jgi:hypothetical protein
MSELKLFMLIIGCTPKGRFNAAEDELNIGYLKIDKLPGSKL